MKTSEQYLIEMFGALWDRNSESYEEKYGSKENFIKERLQMALEADLMDEDENLSPEEESYIEQLDESVVEFGDSRVDDSTMEYAQGLTKELTEKELTENETRNSISIGYSSVKFEKGEHERFRIPKDVFLRLITEYLNHLVKDGSKHFTMKW